MNRYLLFVLLAISSTASAVVIRSDVDDAKYRIPASVCPALVDMPGEGHGVLIAPQWVVTAAHAAPMQGMGEEVTIGGVAHNVERVITYPGYKRLPDALVKEALASGDPSKVYAFLASSDDIALIKLASPVKDVIPVALYRGKDEIGKTIELIGKGATGNGIDGQVPHGSHRTILRHAFNVVTGADARYLWYRFDPPPSGLPLEGILGSGDSGGPVLIEGEGLKQLASLGSWSKYAPDHALQPGLYGQVVFNVRISSYIKWIESVMSAHAATHAMF
ncbi:hypothetical protein BH18VER2_BH18VER2_14910 [soil metagenome]